MLMIFAFTVFIVVISYAYVRNKGKKSLSGHHVMVTGGSSGIGLAFAIEAAQRGASVSLIARNMDKLEQAEKEVKSHAISENQKIYSYSVDVSQNNEDINNVVTKAENDIGPIYMLVNCAGTSVCYCFEETPHSELEKMINTNFYGSMFITRAVVPLMKERREGRIIFFSSIAGLVGLYGYSAYSASKFALVGMAQALYMEVKLYGVGVTISFPPDTDTPGFAEEIKTKLPETNLICESGGLFSSKDVAKNTLDDALNGRFMSICGFTGWLIGTVCSGSMPASILDVIYQALTMGTLRIVMSIYLYMCDRTLKKSILKHS